MGSNKSVYKNWITKTKKIYKTSTGKKTYVTFTLKQRKKKHLVPNNSTLYYITKQSRIMTAKTCCKFPFQNLFVFYSTLCTKATIPSLQKRESEVMTVL